MQRNKKSLANPVSLDEKPHETDTLEPDCHKTENSNGAEPADSQTQMEKVQGVVDYLHKIREKIDDLSVADSVAAKAGSTINTKRQGHADESNSELSKSSIGRFEIIQEIGQGGFSKVFLAYDPNLDRKVALKIPKPSALVTLETRSRFQREAMAAAVLNHPNIVPVFEAGSDGLITYIASGYCASVTLTHWMDNNTISSSQAAQLTLTIADAVAHAHQRGVIHRDLKPDNILVESRADNEVSDRLRITDFGLAKFTEESSLLTTEGAIIGTPAYMSPEQANGSLQVGDSSDLFSIGTILYELLTGKLPFDASQPIKTLAAVQNDDPKRPSTIRRDVPKDLEAICLKCLEKKPAKRYPSAFELKADLERFLNGESVKARSPNWIERSARWTRKNAVLSCIGISVFLLLSTVLFFGWLQYQQTVKSNAAISAQKDKALNNVDEHEKTIDQVLAIYLEKSRQNESLNNLDEKILERILNAQLTFLTETDEDIRIQQIRNYLRICKIFQLLRRTDEFQEFHQTAVSLLAKVQDNHEDFAEFQHVRFELDRLFVLLAIEHGWHEKALSKLDAMEKCQDTIDKVNGTQDLYRRYDIARNRSLVFLNQRDFDSALLANVASLELIDVQLKQKPNHAGLQNSYLRSILEIATISRRLGKRRQSNEYFDRFDEYFSSLPNRIQKLPMVQLTRADFYSERGLFHVGRNKKLAWADYETAIEMMDKLLESRKSMPQYLCSRRWILFSPQNE